LNKVKRIARFIGIAMLALIVILVATGISWTAIQLPKAVDPNLVVENWTAVSNGAHNAFTDLIRWNNDFYLAYRSAPSHISFQSKIVVQRSADAKTWTTLAELPYRGEDIRDPKLAVIKSQLFLYSLKNVDPMAEPYGTVFSSSPGGQSWQPWQDVQPGWLFWQPQSYDNKTWYVAAYSTKQDQVALFQTQDGRNWSKVSVISSGERQSETAITFTADGKLIGVIRLEGEGDLLPATLIVTSIYPFQQWTSMRSQVTRLDGPSIFSYQGLVFAIGRSEPAGGLVFGEQGGLFNKKRTSLYQVTAGGLKKMTDLPGDGDTSYTAIVIYGNEAFVSYYTNDTSLDLPWLLGMFSSANIQIAKLNLPNLERAALALP
jgi:hypothetical protein